MTSVFSGECEFEKAGSFGNGHRSLEQSLANEQFAAIARTFIANIDRLSFLWGLPIQLVHWTGVLVTTTCAARLQSGVPIDDSKKDSSPDFERIWNEIFSKKINRISAEEALARGSQGLNTLLDMKAPGYSINPAEEGVQATLAAMLMAAYAALETLASDLWIEAVNQFPVLAENWSENNKDKQLPLNVLAGYQFNASASMGRILHDTRRVTFESWNDVKKAYSGAFKDEIADAFEPADALFKVEKARHLFAHRGGVVDRQFKEQMKKFAEFSDLAVGERLRLTGPVVRDYIFVCTNCARELAQRVDNWVTRNC